MSERRGLAVGVASGPGHCEDVYSSDPQTKQPAFSHKSQTDMPKVLHI